MRIDKNFRSWLGQSRFMKDLKRIRRRPEIVGFDEALKIGLLYDATDDRDSEAVKSYVRAVRTNYKKDILAIGFVDKKKLAPNQFAQFGLDYFTRKDLNFQMIPVTAVVNNFINEEFDILISLYSRRCFPLRYVAAMSKAKFRVGRYSGTNTKDFDMMVKLSGDPPIRTVIEEIEHFLRILRKNES